MAKEHFIIMMVPNSKGTMKMTLDKVKEEYSFLMDLLLKPSGLTIWWMEKDYVLTKPANKRNAYSLTTLRLTLMKRTKMTIS